MAAVKAGVEVAVGSAVGQAAVVAIKEKEKDVGDPKKRVDDLGTWPLLLLSFLLFLFFFILSSSFYSLSFYSLFFFFFSRLGLRVSSS